MSTPPEIVHPPRPRARIWRLLVGCLLVIVASAGITALLAKHEVDTLTSALSQNPSLKVASGVLAPTGFGDAETLLLVGDDQRALTKYYHHAVLPHSNEMLLVRIDPNKPWISMMSIPRDLRVTIYPPGQQPVTTRFNYAYTAGGIPLLVSTIKQVLGLGVNHVIVITFARFKQAVDDLGCVYSTIDRRYYHSNVGYVAQYQEINLQPGYQRLCGASALSFVSYRHGDTALIRDARDQSLLLDVKREFGPGLVSNIHKFERIFGKVVQTDAGLHSSSEVLNLIGTLISAQALRVRQVNFQSDLLPGAVTATPDQLVANVHSFLYGTDAIPKHTTAAVARAVHTHKAVAQLPLAPVPATEIAAARTAAAGFPFPIEYPRVRAAAATGIAPDLYGCPADALEITCMRTYAIDGPDGARYPAYAIVVSAGLLGQYYDVQGTTWTGAPEFANPDQAVRAGGRTYSLFYSGQHLKTVAWSAHGAEYWIHNTLLDSLGNTEMLAIAEQTAPLAGVGAPTGTGSLRYRHFPVLAAPARTRARASTSTAQTIGSVFGLIAVLLLPVMAILILLRRHDVSALRRALQTSEERAERLRGVVTRALTAPARAPAPPPASVRPRAPAQSPVAAQSPAAVPSPAPAPAPVTAAARQRSRAGR